MNENEKQKYFEIVNKNNKFLSSKNNDNLTDGEVYEFVGLIENYFNEFKIKENNIHFMNILFRMYNFLTSKQKLPFDSLKEKINDFFERISRIDIFYILNLILDYNLEKSFQRDLTIKIANFFYNKGISYLIDDFNGKKIISFELFQLSIKLTDNLFSQNNELVKDKSILDLIDDNNKGLNKIKINDISLKIKELYDNNKNDEKYINQIIELYQTILNLIKYKEEIEYINDFEILYKLGDNKDYLPYILKIMEELNIYIKSFGQDKVNCPKYMEFKRKFDELKKFYEESKNVQLEYFKNDFDDAQLEKLEEVIDKKYNEEKNKPMNFALYIIENYPPIRMSKSIQEFKNDPKIKILVASYSTTFTKKYIKLKNKEKLRVKIHNIFSEMFNNNIELKSVNENGENDGEGTDTEDNQETLRTNYT